jgi:hypothetical protein
MHPHDATAENKVALCSLAPLWMDSLPSPSQSSKIVLFRMFAFLVLCLFHALLCLFGLNVRLKLFSFLTLFPLPNKYIIEEKMLSGFIVIINKNKIFT